jgi:hypothetical protein
MSLRCRGLRCPILLSLASFLFQYVQRPFYIGVAVPGAAAVWGLLAQVPPMGAPPPAAVKPPVLGGRTNFNPPI